MKLSEETFNDSLEQAIESFNSVFCSDPVYDNSVMNRGLSSSSSDSWTNIFSTDDKINNINLSDQNFNKSISQTSSYNITDKAYQTSIIDESYKYPIVMQESNSFHQ